MENGSRSQWEEARSPSQNLHQNGPLPLTKRERLEMIISSRSFTIAATICTFGFYYLYYLFCLEQEQDSPFVPSDLGPSKYPCTKPEEADETFQEAKRMNSRLSLLASGRSPQRISIKPKTILDRITSTISYHIANILNWLERMALYFHNRAWRKNKPIEKPEETNLGICRLINQKLDQMVDKQKEDALTQPLMASLSKTNISHPKDHYLTFVFYLTYIFLSFATLGLFPVYHLLIKNRWNDFQNIRNHKEHSSFREFNDLTGKLMGINGNLEYSYLLLGEKGLPLNLNFFSDAFRTKVFQTHTVRKNIVTFLMLITLGFFGVFVLAKNVFDDNRLKITAEDSAPTDYSSIPHKWERFKLFLLDLFRDIEVASIIAARRVSTINKSISSVLDGHGPNDTTIVKFIKLLSSELYFWLFSFLFICSSIAFITIYTSWYSNFYSHFPFWFSIILSSSFLILFTRHINLLFI